MRYFRTPLDLPLVLFVVSALIGVWASYDPATSWSKFALIVAVVAIYYGISWMRAAPRLLETCVWFFLIGSAALAVYFVTQNDYASQSGKFDLITAIGAAITRVAPQLPFHRSHPNVVAGALEIALPINLGLLWAEGRKQKAEGSRQSFAALLVSLFTCLLITFGLLMTSSRGAWLALGIVGAVGVLLVVAQDALRRYALPLALIVGLATFIAIARFSDAWMPAFDTLLGAIPAGNSVVSRAELFRQAWGLIQDYYFTGSGLGVFPMILSTYALLIDVPFLTHAHNLFLEIWIEQGLLGLVVFGWLIVAFYLWCLRIATNKRMNWLMLGGIAATTVMLLHGFVDVGLYSSRALPLMFVPMGIAVASGQSTVDIRQTAGDSGQATVGRRQGSRLVVGIILLTAGCILLAGFWNSLAALWYANLGSVAQTRAELVGFPSPDWKAGAVRRNGDLSQAQAYFQRALAFEPGNLTANQRLGAIASVRGEYDAARQFFARVYTRDPLNAATWRLEANLDAALGLNAEACQIAAWAKTQGWSGAWIFPLPGCAVK